MAHGRLEVWTQVLEVLVPGMEGLREGWTCMEGCSRGAGLSHQVQGLQTHRWATCQAGVALHILAFPF